MTIRQDPESERIRERIGTLADAIRAKDIDALMAHYASDTVTFDLRPPLRIGTAGAYRRNFEAWFASVRGPIDYEVHDLQIAAAGDVAFCHSLCRVRGVRTDGGASDYWVRVTSGLRSIDGQWMVIHEHISMPVHMETMRAAADATP